MLGPVTPALSTLIRNRLLDRRERLSATIELFLTNTNMQRLLAEGDAALNRLTTSRYGICETCNERIEDRQLLGDPLRRHCISHLAPEEHDKVLRDREFLRDRELLLPTM
jgi:RNA polymerase-binding transcription factor DksA